MRPRFAFCKEFISDGAYSVYARGFAGNRDEPNFKVTKIGLTESEMGFKERLRFASPVVQMHNQGL